MGLSAGELDREIVIQTASVIRDANTGAAAPDWDNPSEATIWAKWLPGSTRESFLAQRQVGSYIDGVYQVYDLDTRPDPDTSRIVGHDGRTYDLKPLVEIGRGEGLLLPVVARGESA